MKRYPCVFGLSLFASLGMLAAGSVADTEQNAPAKEQAAEKPRSEEGAKKEDKKAAERARQVELVDLAYRLAEYGRDTKSPEALIQAAGMLRKLQAPESPEVKLVAGKDKEASPLKPGSFLKESDILLAEARKMSEELTEEKLSQPALAVKVKEDVERSHAYVMSWADKVAKGKRDLIGGPSFAIRQIAPGGYEELGVYFVPGRSTILVVNGDQQSRLHLNVRDPLGQMVAGSRSGQNVQVQFVPLAQGPYSVSIHNDTPANRVVTYRLAGN